MDRALIDQYFTDHAAEMIEDICQMIRIPSDRGAAQPGFPYGPGPAIALTAALELAAAMGFATCNHDNIVGTIDLNDLPPHLDILAHLDVVPGGDGWTMTEPFLPVVTDGRIYGRGAIDDKGPAIAALYALRAVKDLAIPLRKNVRLIFGTDEECGGTDLEYYYRHEKEAPMSFSPDAEFPVINIEKGMLRGELSAEWPAETKLPRLVTFGGGIKINVVPDKAEAVIEGLTIAQVQNAITAASQKTGAQFACREQAAQLIINCVGKSAHAATPQTGNNAITAMLELLAQLPLAEGAGFRRIQALNRLFPHSDWSGRALGVAMQDDISGELTLCLNVLEYIETSLAFMFDCRSPLCATRENLRDVIAVKLKTAGIEMADKGLIPPHHVPAELPFIQTLLRCYEAYSGKPGKCLAIGGGTYVHNLKNGVAFGCADLETDNHLHGPDEFVEIEQLLMSAKIFTQAIIELCG